ncbi:hypothetical protein CXB51_001363 [Gossypium anomalum]|uniref:DUF4283 domain-containing protein n=1 Tax=Gossypium anomalum TaxID=47600 RepID=A0A8J6DEY9_9ROSI|nr:hypothetical protein CXB51_001363 [Gossypium anomalum]
MTDDTVKDGGREILVGDRNTKKVRFKGLNCDMENDMVVDSFPAPEISWRDKVLDRRVPDSGREKDFKLFDGDVTRSTVNGFKACENCPNNSTSWMWKIVQPWTLEFDLLWAFPSNAMVWLKLLGLPGFLYKRQLLEKIGGLIGTRVEFESLPSICFSYGCLGHLKELCPSEGHTKDMVVGVKSTTEDLPEANKVSEVTKPKLAVKGATNTDLSGIHFQKGDFSSTKNHGRSFRDKKNNGAVAVNKNTFSILGQNNMDGLDLLDGAERREVSEPAREGLNKLFGSLVESLSLDKKALENAEKIMAVGPGLTTQ